MELEAPAGSRDYWLLRTPHECLVMADWILSLINEKVARSRQLNYKRQFIGLADRTAKVRNFILNFVISSNTAPVPTPAQLERRWALPAPQALSR